MRPAPAGEDGMAWHGTRESVYPEAMSSKVPRSPDLRREPDSDEDLPTDIYSREELFPPKPKLRLEVPGTSSAPPTCGPEDSTLIVRSSKASVATAAMPRAVRAWLEVVSGPALDVGKFPITMVRTVIGRGHQADIRIHDSRLSRKHATIFFTGEEFRIKDETSGNGTILNGSRVVEYCVRTGDEVIAGGSTFRFRVEHVE
jgi:hypothetical protein